MWFYLDMQNHQKRQFSPRLAGEIAKLVKIDPSLALSLAVKGEKLNCLEDHFEFYFRNRRELQAVKSGKKKLFVIETLESAGSKFSPQYIVDEIKGLEFVVEKVEKELAAEFVFCLRNEDFDYMKVLVKTAQAMSKFKENSDKTRMIILALKTAALRGKRKKFTIREIAQKVGWPEKDSEDGFSALRRICKQLDFPLASSRKLKRFPKR
jgi:hypothetical protein